MQPLWVGWYGNEGASAAQPDTIRWTEGACGDCFRECLSRLESAAPRGRVLVVLRSGALPGRVLRKGQSARKPAVRGRPKTWEAKTPLILAQIDGQWKTLREIQDGLGLRPPGAIVDIRLYPLLGDLVDAGSVTCRARQKVRVTIDPGAGIQMSNMDGPVREYRRVGT